MCTSLGTAGVSFSSPFSLNAHWMALLGPPLFWSKCELKLPILWREGSPSQLSSAPLFPGPFLTPCPAPRQCIAEKHPLNSGEGPLWSQALYAWSPEVPPDACTPPGSMTTGGQQTHAHVHTPSHAHTDVPSSSVLIAASALFSFSLSLFIVAKYCITQSLCLSSFYVSWKFTYEFIGKLASYTSF